MLSPVQPNVIQPHQFLERTIGGALTVGSFSPTLVAQGTSGIQDLLSLILGAPTSTPLADSASSGMTLAELLDFDLLPLLQYRSRQHSSHSIEPNIDWMRLDGRQFSGTFLDPSSGNFLNSSCMSSSSMAATIGIRPSGRDSTDTDLGAEEFIQREAPPREADSANNRALVGGQPIQYYRRFTDVLGNGYNYARWDFSRPPNFDTFYWRSARQTPRAANKPKSMFDSLFLRRLFSRFVTNMGEWIKKVFPQGRKIANSSLLYPTSKFKPGA